LRAALDKPNADATRRQTCWADDWLP